ncbi:hypothetical protein ES703_60186 [subsurface metagenome]
MVATHTLGDKGYLRELLPLLLPKELTGTVRGIETKYDQPTADTAADYTNVGGFTLMEPVGLFGHGGETSFKLLPGVQRWVFAPPACWQVTKLLPLVEFDSLPELGPIELRSGLTLALPWSNIVCRAIAHGSALPQKFWFHGQGFCVFGCVPSFPVPSRSLISCTRGMTTLRGPK